MMNNVLNEIQMFVIMIDYVTYIDFTFFMIYSIYSKNRGIYRYLKTLNMNHFGSDSNVSRPGKHAAISNTNVD